MKNVKRLVALACTTALSVGLFAGCGAAQQGADNGASNSGSQEKVQLAFWEQDEAAAQKVMDELIKDFQSKNPNITVKRTHFENEDLRNNFTSAAVSKNGPDVVFGPADNLGVFVPGKLVQPIDDAIGGDVYKGLDPKVTDGLKWEGKNYFVPDRNGNELLLIYNKKLVTEAPKTWEDVEKITKDLKTAGKIQYGVSLNINEPFFTFPFLNAFGGKVFNGTKPNFDNAETVAWYTFLKKQHDEGVLMKEGDANVANSLFKDGKTAFSIAGPWEFENYKSVDFGYMPLPTVNGKDIAPYSSAKGYYISDSVKDKAKKDAVKKFIEFMNTKDAQLKMVKAHNQIPSNLEAAKDDSVTKNPLLSGQAKALEKAIPMPVITQMRAVWDNAKEIQQLVLAGKVTPEQASKDVQKKITDKIKELGLE